ncbi:MAG TPA: CGNR zinc finger domain-containing protein [Solirubrobacteraceae bacterium]|nr:CGNR zinc finger domain-containing protein [Solirubrobacteraceae bacterium]
MEREALLSHLVHPGGREPAPGSLELVQAFVNTIDREHGPDLLDDDAGLRDWLERRMLPADLAPGDRERAREVREALRALLLANNHDHPRDPAAQDVLEGAARRARLEPAFPPDGATLVPRAGGVDGALGRILAAAFTAMVDGSWARLKACPREICGWAFYDRSTNASATWCSMRVCGGRVKAGAYYRRRRASGH